MKCIKNFINTYYFWRRITILRHFFELKVPFKTLCGGTKAFNFSVATNNCQRKTKLKLNINK